MLRLGLGVPVQVVVEADLVVALRSRLGLGRRQLRFELWKVVEIVLVRLDRRLVALLNGAVLLLLKAASQRRHLVNGRSCLRQELPGSVWALII